MPKKRCHVKGCNKRISVSDEIISKCRCGNQYCSAHRMPECHNCTYDFSFNKEQFIKANKCVAEKIKCS